jgi:nucleoside 2-deoxyribosyltransferase
MIVVLAGSMTAAPTMISLEKRLTTAGHDVILPEFTTTYAQMPDDERANEAARNKVHFDLIRKYFALISKGDCLLVVNEKRKGIQGYVGGNTLIEMGFAHALRKPVYLLHDIPAMDYTDEIRAMTTDVLAGDIKRLRLVDQSCRSMRER